MLLTIWLNGLVGRVISLEMMVDPAGWGILAAALVVGWTLGVAALTQEETQEELDKVRAEIDRIRQILADLERFLRKLLQEGKDPSLIRDLLVYWEGELARALRREEDLLRPWTGVAPPPPPNPVWLVLAAVVAVVALVVAIREGYLPDPAAWVTTAVRAALEATQEGRLTPEQLREFLERFRRGE